MQSSIAEIARLRRFTGPASEFWPALVTVLSSLIGAGRGLLILRDPKQPERLRKLAEWSGAGHADRPVALFVQSLPTLASRGAAEEAVAQILERAPGPDQHHFGLAVTLSLQGTTEQCIATFLLRDATESQAREAISKIQLAADAPLLFQLNQAAVQSKVDVEKFAAVLDVVSLLNAETRFLSASLAFCNGIATRFSCERASLGWLEHGYIRLRAISRMERFDKNMAAVKALEVVMEECLDQDEEVVHPRPDQSNVITQDHEKFSREQNSPHICSVPIRYKNKPTAVLTCERRDRPFNITELQQLRLACDQAATRLSEIRARDRWWGARMGEAMREKLSLAIGPRHTWAKVVCVLGAAAIVLLLLPIFNYRVEGNFIVRSDAVSYQSAPFDGFIHEVFVRPGDRLAKGAPILNLDTTELDLEESAAQSDQTRYLREAEKARASRSLAEMRIAEALADQARARLDSVRYKLSQASIKSPFDGIVVEGDLRQRIGAPVKASDNLLKIARIDTLYVEAEVNERDIHEILDKSKGEIAFVSRPREKFPVHITRIEPVAVPKDKENLFIVRCAFDSPLESWWRPGMSGVCKISVEKRTLLWILTHRTVDFLRLLLWW